jgi:hypothetical protein
MVALAELITLEEELGIETKIAKELFDEICNSRPASSESTPSLFQGPYLHAGRDN